MIKSTVDIKKLQMGFIGVGWIGQNRLDALLRSGIADAKIIADIADENLLKASLLAPYAVLKKSIDCDEYSMLDGIVIATPSGQHFSQVMNALENNVHVFCQKPLARTKREVECILDKAKEKNKNIWIDLSYRYTKAIQKIKERIDNSEIGEVFAINTVFHNSYGPDKQWFYDPLLSGGGCVMDLGIHMIDLSLWVSGFPSVDRVTSNLYSNGKKKHGRAGNVEDFATVLISCSNGLSINVACSWKLSTGNDAIIEFTIYGSKGCLSMKNVNGSFYDFHAYQMNGRTGVCIQSEPDDWGGRAIFDWAERVSKSGSYEKCSGELLNVAEVIDSIYENA